MYKQNPMYFLAKRAGSYRSSAGIRLIAAQVGSFCWVCLRNPLLIIMFPPFSMRNQGHSAPPYLTMFRCLVPSMTGWWLGHPSEKYESQLGWLFPIYGKIKNGNQTTNHMNSNKFSNSLYCTAGHATVGVVTSDEKSWRWYPATSRWRNKSNKNGKLALCHDHYHSTVIIRPIMRLFFYWPYEIKWSGHFYFMGFLWLPIIIIGHFYNGLFTSYHYNYLWFCFCPLWIGQIRPDQTLVKQRQKLAACEYLHRHGSVWEWA